MALLNSAGRCSAICDHTGARCRPSAVRRSSPYASCSASLDAGVPPHHQVGVGAQPGHVVDAAHRHVLRRRAGRTARRPRRPASSRSAGSGWAARNTDHIVYRMLALISRSAGSVLRHVSSVTAISQCLEHVVGGRLAGADADRDADAVVAGAGQREVGCPAASAARAAPPPGPACPGAYCGSAPPHRCTCASIGAGSARADQRDSSARAMSTSSASRRWSRSLLAVPAERRPHQRRRPSAGAGAPHLVVKNVRRLDQRALGRRHQQAGQLGQVGCRQAAPA